MSLNFPFIYDITLFLSLGSPFASLIPMTSHPQSLRISEGLLYSLLLGLWHDKRRTEVLSSACGSGSVASASDYCRGNR
jgi:hypothetical protein